MASTPEPIILASASTARAALLRAAGVAFVVEPAAIDEAALKHTARRHGDSPLGAAAALAAAKALHVASRHPASLVVGADQILAAGSEWFDKPVDLAAARRQLEVLRGRTHTLATAVCLVQDGRIVFAASSLPELTMRRFSDAFLDAYIAAEGDALLGSVGAYRLEARGVQLFSRISGDTFAVLGLPLLELLGFLRERGYFRYEAGAMTITGRTRLAGIMGWPISHSRSPALHNFWLDEHGIDGVYVPMAVRPEHLAQALRALPALGFRGCNLTLPHKRAALSIVDRVDPLAARIGAINTVIVAEDGSLEGSNTDVYGFRESLREEVPDWNPGAGAAVVFGAGGAARAVVAALMTAGVSEIRLVNRTIDRARGIAEDLTQAPGRMSIHPWELREAALEGAGILVNTTSLGMTGEPDLEVDLAKLPKASVVMDVVYVPLETTLLAAARSAGHRTVDGLGMLLHQARPGFEAWFAASVRVTRELRSAVLTTLATGQGR